MLSIPEASVVPPEKSVAGFTYVLVEWPGDFPHSLSVVVSALRSNP
jgi:hypothetical protein